MFQTTRRGFLKESAALGIGLGLTAGQRAKAFAPSETISVACIGVRGRGSSVMQSFAAEPDCEITHICDVRESVRAQRGAEMKDKTGRAPKLVNDYRTLLDDKSIDVFMVATPDHWHALLTIEGCLAGKDVYVEKPASHNILEGKTAVAAARKNNRMVQMGTQIRSAPFLREALDYVNSGALGKVIYGKAWETSRNGEVHLPPDGKPPKGLDYDIWQGPAPERPYNESVVGTAWRWLFDYGTGDLGNDGVHRIDYCRHVMGLDGMPHAISCSGGKFFFGGRRGHGFNNPAAVVEDVVTAFGGFLGNGVADHQPVIVVLVPVHARLGRRGYADDRSENGSSETGWAVGH